MPQVCAIGTCKRNYERTKKLNPPVSYFCFPRDERVQKLWVKRCNRTDRINVKHARVCSLHFREDDFERNLRNELLNLPHRLKLRRGVVPSLNLGPNCDGGDDGNKNNNNTSSVASPISRNAKYSSHVGDQEEVKYEEISIKSEPPDDNSDFNDGNASVVPDWNYSKSKIAYIPSDIIPKLTPIPRKSPPPLISTTPQAIPTLRWFGNRKDDDDCKDNESVQMETNQCELLMMEKNETARNSHDAIGRYQQADQDSDGMEFFKYYFPYVKMLSPAQKLKVGIKIHQAFLEELQNK